MVSPLLLVAALGAAWAGTVRVDVLDVGQGDAILIRTPADKTILIDAGDGDVSVPRLLEGLGVKAIDLAIGTHPHADHIGGMDDVLDALPVKNYVDNGLAHTTKTYDSVMERIEAKEIAYRSGMVGMSFNLDDGVVLEVLFPEEVKLKDTRSDLNSNSVVARLTHGENCFLFTGDSEEPTERALVNNGLGQCDVLKVAHHGSNHSSTNPFLNAVKPTIAVISVGTGNRYGHPGEETLDRLQAIGAEIYRTDTMGQVTLLSDKKKVTVETGKPRPMPGQVVSNKVAPEPPPKAAPPAKTDGASADASRPAHDLDPAHVENIPSVACPFPSSASSEVFHEAGCGNASRISPSNLVCYQTQEQALKSGKRPAGCCKPGASQ